MSYDIVMTVYAIRIYIYIFFVKNQWLLIVDAKMFCAK